MHLFILLYFCADSVLPFGVNCTSLFLDNDSISVSQLICILFVAFLASYEFRISNEPCQWEKANFDPHGWLDSVVVIGRRTCDREVASSTPVSSIAG